MHSNHKPQDAPAQGEEQTNATDTAQAAPSFATPSTSARIQGR